MTGRVVAISFALALLASACGRSTETAASEPVVPVDAITSEAWVSVDDPTGDVRLAARPEARSPIAAIDVQVVALRRSVDALHIRFTHVPPQNSPEPITDEGVTGSAVTYSGLGYAIRLWGPEDEHRYLVLGVHPEHATSIGPGEHGPFVCEYDTCDMEEDEGPGLVTVSETSLEIEVPWERLDGLRGVPATWIAWSEWVSELEPDALPDRARDWIPNTLAPDFTRKGNANVYTGPGCCLSVAPEYRLDFPVEPPMGS